MAPPIESFPASSLGQKVQVTAKGRRRKGEDVDLKKCELLEMMQYSCQLEADRKKGATDVIRCTPIIRTFRKCGANLMVETTDFEEKLPN